MPGGIPRRSSHSTSGATTIEKNTATRNGSSRAPASLRPATSTTSAASTSSVRSAVVSMTRGTGLSAPRTGLGATRSLVLGVLVDALAHLHGLGAVGRQRALERFFGGRLGIARLGRLLDDLGALVVGDGVARLLGLLQRHVGEVLAQLVALLVAAAGQRHRGEDPGHPLAHSSLHRCSLLWVPRSAVSGLLDPVHHLVEPRRGQREEHADPDRDEAHGGEGIEVALEAPGGLLARLDPERGV